MPIKLDKRKGTLMNNEISLSMFWRVFKNSWLKIVIIALACALLMGLFTHYFIKKQYSSSISFYVINANTSAEYTQTSLIAANTQLANDYIEIIQSDAMMSDLVDAIKEECGVEYTPKQVRKMMEATVKGGSSVFEIKITNTNKDHAYAIAEYIAENAPEQLLKTTKPWVFEKTEAELADEKKDATDCVNVINYPHLAVEHDSPSLLKNTAIAGIAGAVLTYAIFFLIVFFDTLVKNEEDIKEFTEKYPLIGIIPSWYTE